MLEFRIGTKLAIVGGVGLIMVGAIALNETWDRHIRAGLATEAGNAATVRTSTLDAAVASRRIVIMGRDIRLATSPADVDNSASSPVLSSAQSLANESNRLKLEIGKFLETVRAA